MSEAKCPIHGRRLISTGYSVLACPEPKCQYARPVTALEDKQDGDKRKAQPIREKVLEADLQEGVIDRLNFEGYEVMETGKTRAMIDCPKCHTRHYPTGWQGNTESLPDLFIRGKEWPVGVYVAVELKGSQTPVRPGQQELCDRAGSYICRSWEEVLEAVQQTEKVIPLF